MIMVSESTKLKELLVDQPSAMAIFEAHGLECAGCLGVEFETVRDACVAHGLDVLRVITELNAHLAHDEQ